jgi:hypothetical protein
MPPFFITVFSAPRVFRPLKPSVQVPNFTRLRHVSSLPFLIQGYPYIIFNPLK